MDFRIGTGGMSYTNALQTNHNKQVERQSFQGGLEKVIQYKKLTEPQDKIEFLEKSVINKSELNDSMDFSGMTDAEKLEKIKELNDNTDFSSMTDVEKYGIIRERYETAFPDLRARMVIGLVADSANKIPFFEINFKIRDQYEEDMKKVGVSNTKEIYAAYKGYDKMTEEQKWESIQKQYGNPKNGIEQICALSEACNAGLIDVDVFHDICSRVRQKANHAGAESRGRDYVGEKLFTTSIGDYFGYEWLQNNKIDFNEIGTEAKQYKRFDDLQMQREFNFEVDYITYLMNALDERED